MWRSRKLIALFLLVLFAPASGAAALPLVWCVAPGGHSAIERAAVSGYRDLLPGLHLAESQHEAKVLCAETGAGHGGCIDWGVSQPTRSTIGLSFIAPPPPDGGALKLLTKLEEHSSLTLPPPVPPHSLDLIADRLTQLRTVVLLI